MGSEKSSEFSRKSLFFKSTACLEYYSLGSASDNYDNNPAHEYLAACSAYYSALSAFQEPVLIDQINAAAASPRSKRQKTINGRKDSASASHESIKMSHITVERNRRQVMNERLSVLRSLMPRSYIKKSDKASIIGGVVNYIHELQQILRSLECKKKSKASSPKHPPRSPNTSRSSSPYKPRLHQKPAFTSPIELPPSDNISSTSSSTNDTVNELVATSRSVAAEVEVKFSGPNLLLKTTSRRIPGQALRIISALEELELEILDATFTTVDHKTIIHSFTIKIGIECQLSAEELAQQIQRTFR